MCYQANSDLEFNPTEMDEASELGRMSRAARKRRRKRRRQRIKKALVKVHTAPLKAIHKITHGKKSPIRKLELKLQGAVGKALPFTKPFIQAHNKAANLTYKAMEKAKIIGKGDTLKVNSPTNAAINLAATMKTGKTMMTPEQLASMRADPQFRAQMLDVLSKNAKAGNQTAWQTLMALR